MIKKLRSFFETVKDVALFAAATPTALKTAGAFTKGVSTTIASPKVASFVSQLGSGLIKTGTAIGNVLKAGTSAVVKRAVVPVAKTAAKSLPGSKFINPIAKYIPSAAALYGIVSGTASAIRQVKALSTAKDPVKRGTMSSAQMASTGKDFNPTQISSYIDLFKRVLTFK